MGLSSSRVVVIYAHETRKPLAFATASAKRDDARGPDNTLGPAQRASAAGAGTRGGRWGNQLASIPKPPAVALFRVVVDGRDAPSRPGRKAHICCLSGGTDGVSPEGPQRSIHVSSLWIEGSSVDPIGGRNSRRLCRRIEAALSRFWTRVDREIVVVAGASSDQQLLRVLASVKARRCAPPPLRGAHGLDAGSVRIPDEVERRFRTKWEHRFRRKWNIDSGKWNTDSGKWNVDSGRSGTSAPGIVNARR